MPACLSCYCPVQGWVEAAPRAVGVGTHGVLFSSQGCSQCPMLELGWVGFDLRLECQPALPNCRGTWGHLL